MCPSNDHDSFVMLEAELLEVVNCGKVCLDATRGLNGGDGISLSGAAVVWPRSGLWSGQFGRFWVVAGRHASSEARRRQRGWWHRARYSSDEGGTVDCCMCLGFS